MSVTTKIRRQGGTAIMTIPPVLLKMLGADIGGQLSLVVENGTLVASPVSDGKKRYTLAELLEGADEMAELNAQASAWNSPNRVGNELF